MLGGKGFGRNPFGAGIAIFTASFAFNRELPFKPPLWMLMIGDYF